MASPCPQPSWGRITTQKLSRDKTRLYLHAFNWKKDCIIVIPIDNNVKKCCLLADSSRKFETTTTENGVAVKTTGNKPDDISSVIVMDITGEPHSEKPACASACPVSAINKRAEDGIVLVDQSECIGCRMCLTACPFGAPQFDGSGVMSKCDYCIDRLAVGKQPACVATCPTGALHGGTMDNLSRLSANKAGVRLAGETQPAVLISK